MNKKGFTLIELLAVIVILGIIMVIAGSSVIKSIRETEKKTKFMAAKEIIKMAEAYIEVNNINDNNIKVEALCNDYIEKDATNPETGKSISDCKKELSNQIIRIDSNSGEQEGFELNNNCYVFSGYQYCIE